MKLQINIKKGLKSKKTNSLRLLLAFINYFVIKKAIIIESDRRQEQRNSHEDIK